MSHSAGRVPRHERAALCAATRAGYDAVAADYAQWVSDDLAAKPMDRGHVVSLDFYRFQPDRVAQLLHDAGFAVFARLLREPDKTEKVQQAYLLAGKSATNGDVNEVL